jgi:hypothetical protein
MRIQRLTRTGLAAFAVLAGGLLLGVAPALAAPEKPTTEAANPIGGTSATLNGTLNPNVSATTGYEFYYGEQFCGETATPEGAEATGKGIKVSALLTRLEGNTEYKFCVVATHAENGVVTERTEGAPESFKTLPVKPVVAGGEVSGATPFQASVANVSVNPENEPTSCELEYGKKPGYTKKVKCVPEPVEGGAPVAVSWTLTGLESATTYDYLVKAKNGADGAEETTGAEGEFTTLVAEAPIVESQSAPRAKVTASGALLEAQINPNYQETSYKFEYSTSPTLAGAKTAAGTSLLPPEFAVEPVSVTIGGLQPRITYYYRVVATNGTGPTADPNIESVTTLGVPIVTTNEASPLSITQTMAEVSGTINPGGAPTFWHIAYIPQAGYEAAVRAGAANPYAGGIVTTILDAGSEYTAGEVTAKLSELAPGTTYDYTVVARNSAGITIGPNMTFTTEAGPPGNTQRARPDNVTATPLGAAPVGSTFPNLTAIAPIPGPKEVAETPGAKTKSLTRAQKLNKALKACKHKAKGKQRASCEKQAHAKYGKSTRKKGK